RDWSSDVCSSDLVYQVFNGALECSLLVVDPVQPPLREDATPRPLSPGAQMLANRLRKNLRALKSWRVREGIGCYRAYDADLPEYSAAIDVYTEADDPDATWLHVQEYAAPADIPDADVRRRFGEVLAAAREVFGVSRARVARAAARTPMPRPCAAVNTSRCARARRCCG